MCLASALVPAEALRRHKSDTLGKQNYQHGKTYGKKKPTRIKEKALLHNSVAPELMPMLGRSETQFREAVVVWLLRATAAGPALGRLRKAPPAAPPGTWRGMATAECRECARTSRVHLGAVPPATQRAPVVLRSSKASELGFCTTHALPLPSSSDGCLASGAL